ncbi:MAG: MFS transporter [Polyangiales bacterium]
MAISYVDRHTLSVLAPTVTRALRIDDAHYGWLAAAFSIAYLVAAPIAGRLVDRVGARRGLLGAVLVWSAVAALHALAPGFALLFALRIALGVAEAPSFPGAAQTMQRALPPGDRARGFGVLFAGSSIGAMLAPVLATTLEARFGWRIAFLGTALVGLLWVPAWIAVAYAGDVRPILDAVDDPTARLPPPFGSLLVDPAVVRGALAVAATAPAIGLVMMWGAKYLERHHGVPQAQMGRYLFVPPLFYDLGSILAGDLASRRARKRDDPRAPDRLLFLGSAALALTMILGTGAQSPSTLVVWFCVALAGYGAMFALLTADLMMRVPSSAVSTVGGLTAAAQSLALIVSSIVIGREVQSSLSFTGVVLGVSLWTVPGAAAWLLWSPRDRAVQAPSAR